MRITPPVRNCRVIQFFQKTRKNALNISVHVHTLLLETKRSIERFLYFLFLFPPPPLPLLYRPGVETRGDATTSPRCDSIPKPSGKVFLFFQASEKPAPL